MEEQQNFGWQPEDNPSKYHMPEEPDKANNKAVLSLVLGILSLVLQCVCCMSAVCQIRLPCAWWR